MAFARLFFSTLLAALLYTYVLAVPIHQRAPVGTAPKIDPITSTAPASPPHKATSWNTDKNTAAGSDKYELFNSNNEVVKHHIPSAEERLDEAESPTESTKLNKVYQPVDSKLDPKELNLWKTSNPISTGGKSNEKEYLGDEGGKKNAPQVGSKGQKASKDSSSDGESKDKESSDGENEASQSDTGF